VKLGQVFVKTSQPGDEGKNTFRMEIGMMDGSIPSPAQVFAHMIWVAKDIAEASEIKDVKGYFHELVDHDAKLKKEFISG
jgi:hypothetical protein